MYRQTSGPASTALWANGGLTSDYNDLCVDTTFANSYTAWLNSYYRTFSNWQGAGYDQNSVSLMPPFVGPNDLHIAYVLTAIADGGTPLTGILTDIDGNVRPHAGHSRPDIGADEFDHPPVSVEEEVGEVPGSFTLLQNYPNPFNPSTTISFQVPEQCHVTLKVFDVVGREIATLVNEVEQPGTHTAQWNASRVASGVYFYRIQAGDFVASKKLLLLR